jgi:hypothetical protein
MHRFPDIFWLLVFALILALMYACTCGRGASDDDDTGDRDLPRLPTLNGRHGIVWCDHHRTNHHDPTRRHMFNNCSLSSFNHHRELAPPKHHKRGNHERSV